MCMKINESKLKDNPNFVFRVFAINLVVNFNNSALFAQFNFMLFSIFVLPGVSNGCQSQEWMISDEKMFGDSLSYHKHVGVKEPKAELTRQ